MQYIKLDKKNKRKPGIQTPDFLTLNAKVTKNYILIYRLFTMLFFFQLSDRFLNVYENQSKKRDPLMRLNSLLDFW